MATFSGDVRFIPKSWDSDTNPWRNDRRPPRVSSCHPTISSRLPWADPSRIPTWWTLQWTCETRLVCLEMWLEIIGIRFPWITKPLQIPIQSENFCRNWSITRMVKFPVGCGLSSHLIILWFIFFCFASAFFLSFSWLWVFQCHTCNGFHACSPYFPGHQMNPCLQTLVIHSYILVITLFVSTSLICGPNVFIQSHSQVWGLKMSQVKKIVWNQVVTWCYVYHRAFGSFEFLGKFQDFPHFPHISSISPSFPTAVFNRFFRGWGPSFGAATASSPTGPVLQRHSKREPLLTLVEKQGKKHGKMSMTRVLEVCL